MEIDNKTKEITIDFVNDDVILHELLGSGGSGAQVYKCTIAGFTCAAKILRTETVPEEIEAVKREIRIMETLSNENIVKYLGHDLSIRGEIRLYLELYSGTLHDVIMQRKKEKKAFTPGQVCGYLFQVAKGLNYLHSLSTPILHRDLKSENIFITYDPQRNLQTLKIGDFDSSKILEHTKTTYTKNTGTEGFMAPEVIDLKDKGYSAKVDVFSFGMVMYEMMTMEMPYFDIHPAQRWEKVKNGKRPSVSPEVEQKFKTLIPLWKLCTSKDPSKRPLAKKLVAKLSEMM